jgi:hypothetical protein
MEKIEKDSIEYLLQLDIVEGLMPNIKTQPKQRLYSSDGGLAIWCALLNEDAVAEAIEKDSWDLHIGSKTPYFDREMIEGDEKITYHAYGSDNGIRSLVLVRDFHSAFPSYVEFNEEFRLYHNLVEDRDRGVLLTFDQLGQEIEVAWFRKDRAEANIKYLRQYQAATGLYLVIYIDSIRYSNVSFESIPQKLRQTTHIDGKNLMRWRRDIGENKIGDGYSSFSVVIGKVIFAPPDQSRSGVWPFETEKDKEDRQEIEFIIGVNQEGNDIRYTSNPDKLSNYFGANPGAPNYVTPVYFRREVLTKYYSENNRYTVSDGYITCLSLWSCRIDNNHDKHIVSAFLGDLGKDLPYKERLHWVQYNIPPQGGISRTNWKRSFLGQFAEAEAPDILFREQYKWLKDKWELSQGWPLFLPLLKGDQHLINTIRIPTVNTQDEFDEQVINLTKLLVDSLNEKALKQHAGPFDKDVKGIMKFELYLQKTNFPDYTVVIQFLRDLQSLRSAGSAHLKGSNYEKVITKLNIDLDRKPEAARQLFTQAYEILRLLHIHYCSDSEKK